MESHHSALGDWNFLPKLGYSLIHRNLAVSASTPKAPGLKAYNTRTGLYDPLRTCQPCWQTFFPPASSQINYTETQY